jgi:hypothetical protein
MAASTRPLTLGEILDRTVQLYRRNFLLFAGISTLPAAFMVLAFGGIGILLSTQSASLKSGGQQGAIVLVLVLIAALLIGIPLVLAMFSLALGASNYAVLHASRDEKVTIRASYGYAFRHFWRYLGILFMQALLAFVVPYLVFLAIFTVGSILATLLAKSGTGTALQGLFIFLLVILVIALMVACIYLWLRFSLAFAASVAEDKKIWPSMERSSQLSKGTRGRIFVMFLLVSVLSLTISFALLIPMFILIAVVMQKSLTGPTPPPMFLILIETANLGVSFLVRAFVMPIYSTALLLFYYDQRIRLEGYDIEQLMVQAGWTEIPPPSPPPLPPSVPPPLPPAPVPPPPVSFAHAAPGLAEIGPSTLLLAEPFLPEMAQAEATSDVAALIETSQVSPRPIEPRQIEVPQEEAGS